MAIVCAVMFIEAFLHGRSSGNGVATLWGVLLALACGAGFTQGGEFDFDFLQRKLVWTRGSLFGSRRKTIPFSDIESAIVQREALDDSTQGRYRLALMTKEGLIPLSTVYSEGIDHQLRYEEVCAIINKMLEAGPAFEGRSNHTTGSLRIPEHGASRERRDCSRGSVLLRARRGCSYCVIGARRI